MVVKAPQDTAAGATDVALDERRQSGEPFGTEDLREGAPLVREHLEGDSSNSLDGEVG
jgi:hypothetical protein